jgi:nucleotide-binding universal stress UspA family protein
MKTVLAPIDFSPVSRQVVDEAIAIARGHDARLVLLHVVQLAAVLGTGVTESDLPASFRLQVESDAVRQLSSLQRRLRDEGVTAHVVHQVGSPGERILDQADRLDADYIVMGSHGHGAFYDLIVGSTTSRVVTWSKCPVMIIPLKNRPNRSGQLHPTMCDTVGA